MDFFENCYTKCSKFRINLFMSLPLTSCTQAEALLFVSKKSIWGAWPYGPAPISLRDLALLTNYPSHSTRLRHTAVTFTVIKLRFPTCLSLKILIWLLASKVNVELSERLKYTVKGFKTASKGFSILLEKFGCGCTQQSWRQCNKGEQIFHLFCLLISCLNSRP